MLNRAEKENVFRQRLSKVAAGGTFDDLKFGPIKAGEIYHIQGLAMENEATTITDIRVFIDGHGYNHYLYEQKAPAAGYLYWAEDDFYVFEGEELVIRFTGCDPLDKLAAYLNGTFIVIDKKVE